MKLKENEVTINEQEFTIRELSIGVMMPILPKLQEGGENAMLAQFDLLKACVFVDGKSIGDDVLNIGVATYMQLAEEVLDINGVKLEGKD